MAEVPQVVAAAARALIERRSRDTTSTRIRPRAVEPGQVRLITALSHQPAGSRLGLVLRVDSDNEYVELALAHSAPEMATDSDLVIAEGVGDLPHPLVVESDLRAVVWTMQLGASIGAVSEEHLRTLQAGAPLGPREPMDVGLPLQGPADPRWSFKQDEGDALRRLAADCTMVLLDYGMTWSADPRLLRPEVLDLVSDPRALMQELMHCQRTRRMGIAADGVSELEGLLELLDPTAWSQFPDIADAIVDGLGGLLEHAATAEPRRADARGEPRCLVTSPDLQPDSSVDEYDAVLYVGGATAGAR